MKLYIFHAITAAGQRIDAGVFSDVDIERTRDVFERALREEHPTAVIVSYHEQEPEEGAPEPERRALPSAMAIATSKLVMVMLGILTVARLIQRGMR